jgi:hypothetical protein
MRLSIGEMNPNAFGNYAMYSLIVIGDKGDRFTVPFVPTSCGDYTKNWIFEEGNFHKNACANLRVEYLLKILPG